MGVYLKAFVVLVGGLLGGSVGFYYQAKEESRLADLRKLKLDEIRRLNQQAAAAAENRPPPASDNRPSDY
ncbi:hypothetical protein IWW55_003226 [Coemansia sp. RSA 2706]|nr:hypothetical protein LPJ63_004161 [Coemansia sp. RSA 2711]KAJ2302846.1 hypothetical protein IWW55_003226 [Coemansia sp. RSA 2706]KAJ2306746.1 hypothetical protein IWW54_004640 [Coemansia sp. RSA 2705]KAJ2313856.1 hypothetical protein IWW52_004451 [Coemansia sp. RSA 2704]KAJ2324594.1 hypothetical protein IWW51_003199 [Coemansia sp. RSA 2702]KAJ2380987.1 hypothetical protein H4S02_006423 [Coemansia sp. RSA 2611]KAJ2722515.1 hypothetical protein H4R23_004465 [Coemansia sp. Cherry 401B]